MWIQRILGRMFAAFILAMVLCLQTVHPRAPMLRGVNPEELFRRMGTVDVTGGDLGHVTFTVNFCRVEQRLMEQDREVERFLRRRQKLQDRLQDDHASLEELHGQSPRVTPKIQADLEEEDPFADFLHELEAPRTRRKQARESRSASRSPGSIGPRRGLLTPVSSRSLLQSVRRTRPFRTKSQQAWTWLNSVREWFPTATLTGARCAGGSWRSIGGPSLSLDTTASSLSAWTGGPKEENGPDSVSSWTTGSTGMASLSTSSRSSPFESSRASTLSTLGTGSRSRRSARWKTSWATSSSTTSESSPPRGSSRSSIKRKHPLPADSGSSPSTGQSTGETAGRTSSQDSIEKRETRFTVPSSRPLSDVSTEESTESWPYFFSLLGEPLLSIWPSLLSEVSHEEKKRKEVPSGRSDSEPSTEATERERERLHREEESSTIYPAKAETYTGTGPTARSGTWSQRGTSRTSSSSPSGSKELLPPSKTLSSSNQDLIPREERSTFEEFTSMTTSTARTSSTNGPRQTAPRTRTTPQTLPEAPRANSREQKPIVSTMLPVTRSYSWSSPRQTSKRGFADISDLLNPFQNLAEGTSATPVEDEPSGERSLHPMKTQNGKSEDKPELQQSRGAGGRVRNRAISPKPQVRNRDREIGIHGEKPRELKEDPLDNENTHQSPLSLWGLLRRTKRQVMAGLGLITGVISILGLGLEEAQIQDLTRRIEENRDVEDVLVTRITEDEVTIKSITESFGKLTKSTEKLVVAEDEAITLGILNEADVLFEEATSETLSKIRLWALGVQMLRQRKFPLWLVDPEVYRDAVREVGQRAGEMGLEVYGNVYDPDFTVLILEGGLRVTVHLRLRSKTRHEVLRYSGMPFELSNHSLVAELAPQHKSEILVTNGNSSMVFSSYEFDNVCPLKLNGSYLCQESLLMRDVDHGGCLDALHGDLDQVQERCDLRFHSLRQHVLRVEDDRILLVGSFPHVVVRCKTEVSRYSVKISAVATVPKGCNFSAGNYDLISLHHDLGVEIPESAIWNVSIPLNVSSYFGDETSLEEIQAILRTVEGIEIPQLLTRESLQTQVQRVRTQSNLQLGWIVSLILGGMLILLVILGAIAYWKRGSGPPRGGRRPRRRRRKFLPCPLCPLRLTGGNDPARSEEEEDQVVPDIDGRPDGARSRSVSGPGFQIYRDQVEPRIQLPATGPLTDEQLEVRRLAGLVSRLWVEASRRQPLQNITNQLPRARRTLSVRPNSTDPENAPDPEPLPNPNPEPDQAAERLETVPEGIEVELHADPDDAGPGAA